MTILPSRTMENEINIQKDRQRKDRERIIKLIIARLITAHFISRLSKLFDTALEDKVLSKL